MISAAVISLWLTTHGYHDAQIYAIATYIKRESEYRPCIRTRRGSYLQQYVGSRKRRLENWTHHVLKIRGCPPWRVQLAFMDYEIKETPLKYMAFMKARDPTLAYRIFCTVFGAGKKWRGQ